jgi:DNA repair protein MmcB-like
MDNEPYRDITHDEAADLIASAARNRGSFASREFRLPSGRIADVLIQSPDGNIDIVEVKETIIDSLIAVAYGKYWHWCSRLWVASPHPFLHGAIEPPWPIQWPQAHDSVGLLHVQWERITQDRIAAHHHLSPAHHSMLWPSLQNARTAGEARSA